MAIALAGLLIGLPLLLWAARWLIWALTSRKPPLPRFPWGRTLVVGADNRASTSKTIAFVWTYSVAAALFSFVIARWLGHAYAYGQLIKNGLDAQYALLIGGPLGAAILAKGIVTAQLNNGDSSKPPADSANPAQLGQDDAGNTDLGDVQYLLFNTIALVFFYGEFFRAPQNGMPKIPDVLLGLTSVAAVGYVAKKTLSGPPTIANVAPEQAKVGDTVTLLTNGIAQTGDDLSLIDVAFPNSGAISPDELAATTTQGVLLQAPVPAGAAGLGNLTVSVQNGKSATWPGFKIKPVIDVSERSQLEGREGQQVAILTTGLSGLSSLLGVSVKVGGTPASNVQFSGSDPTHNTVLFTVPNDLAEGEQPLTITTPGGTSDPATFAVVK